MSSATPESFTSFSLMAIQMLWRARSSSSSSKACSGSRNNCSVWRAIKTHVMGMVKVFTQVRVLCIHLKCMPFARYSLGGRKSNACARWSTILFNGASYHLKDLQFLCISNIILDRLNKSVRLQLVG